MVKGYLKQSYEVGKFKRVIIITGTPGVGKTSVSSNLTSNLRALLLDLTKIVEEERLVLGFDEGRRSLIADLEKLSETVKDKIDGTHHDVVVEGHYAPDVVSRDLASHVFVLRRDPDDLKKKLEERGFERNKVKENVAAEILDVCLGDAVKKYGLEKVCEIDTTGKSVEEVVDEVLRVLEGLEKMAVGKFDWLSKLEVEGRLEDFLGQL